MASKISSKIAGTTIGSNDGVLPNITKDPRFVAARKLVSLGQSSEGPAVEMFAILLEETRRVYGDSHIQTAACYYEYGNALFRSSQQNEGNNNIKNNENNVRDNPSPDKKIAPKKENFIKSTGSNNFGKEEESTNSMKKEDENGIDDVSLALELMETSYAIIEEYMTSSMNSNIKTTIKSNNGESSPSLMGWAKNQIPRVYTGIGDVLSHLGRHADAVDSYTRAIPHRERDYTTLKKINNNISLECLKARRLIVEANVLVAEELLACDPNQDVVTTESKQLLVNKEDRIDFAKGYYDKAREELQETVFLMGKIAAAGLDLGTEKEDICFLATILMGVGTTLAEIEESNCGVISSSNKQSNDSDEKPPSKKLKKGT